MLKKLIIAVILLAVLAGAIYWYLEIYSPVRYAKAVTALWEQFQFSMIEDSELTAVNFNDEKDYAGALRILGRRLEIAEKTRNGFLFLRPSRNMKEIHADLLFVTEGYLAVTADARRRAAFFADAVAFTKIFEPDSPPFDPGSATVRQFQDHFKSVFPAAIRAGDALFSEDPPPLHGDISFAKLKVSWEELKPALSIMLSYILKQNPEKRMQGYSPTRPTPEEDTAQNKLNSFGQKLDSAMRQNTTRGILSYSAISSLGGITEEEYEMRFKKVETEIENLKNKYVK